LGDSARNDDPHEKALWSEARTWSFRYASARAAHSWHRFKNAACVYAGQRGTGRDVREIPDQPLRSRVETSLRPY
jgi:hypothetical protein